MLRLGFLPSDFNPMLLVLGEAEDLRRLAGVLRRFARDGADLALEALPGCAAAPGTGVRLTAAKAAQGLHKLAGTDPRFAWALRPAEAEGFAARIEALAATPAGSEMLEVGPPEASIPVKVSCGEYTDDFLLPAGLRTVPG